MRVKQLEMRFTRNGVEGEKKEVRKKDNVQIREEILLEILRFSHVVKVLRWRVRGQCGRN